MQPVEMSYRLYIDESGDHAYKRVADLSRRYLGITGVLIDKAYYAEFVQPELERLKRKLFRYDPDIPPVLVRSHIVKKKSHFGVLRDPKVNQEWEESLLELMHAIKVQIFTVVIDKQVHLQRYPVNTWNPYTYGLDVLLSRIRGFLALQGSSADVMLESRGSVEDGQVRAAYEKMWAEGAKMCTAEEFRSAFPEGRLLFRKKEHNIAGLQIADLAAAEQKLRTLTENGKPVFREPGPFGNRLNEALEPKINRYGRYLLE